MIHRYVKNGIARLAKERRFQAATGERVFLPVAWVRCAAEVFHPCGIGGADGPSALPGGAIRRHIQVK